MRHRQALTPALGYAGGSGAQKKKSQCERDHIRLGAASYIPLITTGLAPAGGRETSWPGLWTPRAEFCFTQFSLRFLYCRRYSFRRETRPSRALPPIHLNAHAACLAAASRSAPACTPFLDRCSQKVRQPRRSPSPIAIPPCAGPKEIVGATTDVRPPRFIMPGQVVRGRWDAIDPPHLLARFGVGYFGRSPLPARCWSFY